MRNTNILSELTSQQITPVQFDGIIVAGEQKAPVKVSIDADGAVLNIKQGDIRLPRDCWISANGFSDRVILMTHSHNYEDWVKKLKYESKNPGQIKSDLPLQTLAWNIEIKASKLGPELVQRIQQTLQHVDLDIYVRNQQAPETLHISRCPSCSTPIDVTPYPDSDALFCNHCSQLFSERPNSDSARLGICNQCTYYTKLKSGESKICYRCNARNTFSAFAYSLLTTFGIVALNIGTVVFLDRYFPVLLLFAAVSFLWSMIKLVGMITVSAARKATGTSPLERATAALRKGKTDDAMRIIDSIPDADRNPGVILNLTRGLINQGNHQKALQFADMLVEQYPNFQFGYAARIEALSLSGAPPEQLRDAVDAMNEVVSRNTLRTKQQLQWLGMAS